MSKFLQKAVGRGLREAGAVLKEEGGAEVRQKIQSLAPISSGLSLSRRCAVMFWFRFLPCCVVETFFLTYRIISLVFWECSFSLDIDRK